MIFCRRTYAGPFVLLMLAMSGPGTAQMPPMLAASLARARLPDKGGILAVDAAKVPLSRGAAAPEEGVPVAAVAAAYGRLAQDFGSVTAVAPPTMAVLNTGPAANPFADLPRDKALMVLLAMLNDVQWQALTGERGLGKGDLADDDQRALFNDVLPSSPWEVVPSGTVRHSGDARDLTAERLQARLRLRLHVGLNLPASNGEDTIFVSPSTGRRAGGDKRSYGLRGQLGLANANIAGVAVRAEVPNAAKPGDLDLDSRALQVRVPLAGLHTVGDLVSRIGSVAHLELYPDAHYEKKSVTWVSTEPSAPAADLLRAIAFDLTATYRQIGPAFVLTDDVQGIGTRRQRLAEFSKDIDARRKAVLERTVPALARHSLQDLPPDDPDLALSDEEWERVKQNRKNLIFGMVYMKLPFRTLSAGQRQAIRGSEGTNGVGEPLSPDLAAMVTVKAQPLLEWLLPSLDGPITGDAVEDLPLGFRGPGAVPSKAVPGVAAKVLPSWPILMRFVPRRAIHVHPRTAAQAEADVVAAKTLGLNQLWVDTFSAGQPHEAVLDAALKAAEGTGVQVFAVLDLFDWGPKAAFADADLTIEGDTSAQAAARERGRDAQIAADKGEAPPGMLPLDIIVSPFSPTVRQTLLPLVTRLAQRPGVAGLVWRETDPPGYDRPAEDVSDDRPMLGYTPAARLAFLRMAHVDPVDLPTSSILLSGTDTSLPLYDDNHLSETLEAKWRHLRTDANLALLRDLYAAAQAGPARRTVLVQNRGNHVFDLDGWYGTWDAAGNPLPVFMDPFNAAPQGQPAYAWGTISQARPQSRTVLTRLPVDGLLQVEDVNSKVGLDVEKIVKQRAASPKLAWDGFVLEAAQEAIPEQPAGLP